MDLQYRGPYSYAGLASITQDWEQQILNQQHAAQHHRQRKPIRRRRVVPGIPQLNEFVADWEKRHNRKDQSDDDFTEPNTLPDTAAGEATSDQEPHPSRSTSSGFRMFDFSDLDEGLRSSNPNAYNRASCDSPRCAQLESPDAQSSLVKSSMSSYPENAYSSPKRMRTDRTFADRTSSIIGSTASFRETILQDKIRWKQAPHSPRFTRNRPRPSALPKPEEFRKVPQIPVFIDPEPISPGNPLVYHFVKWRRDCEEQLKDKATMTSIPPFPTKACDPCAQHAAMLAFTPNAVVVQDLPFCVHSLEELFRAGAIPPQKDKHNPDKLAYLKILKEERSRWHTDRFGGCKPQFKDKIEKTANNIFVTVNELYENEKEELGKRSIGGFNAGDGDAPHFQHADDDHDHDDGSWTFV